MPSQKTKTASCLSLMLTCTQRDMDFMERIPSAFACETLPSSRLNGVETPTRGVNSYFTSTLLVGCVASVHRLKGSFSGKTMTVFILYLTQIKSSKKPSSDLHALIWGLWSFCRVGFKTQSSVESAEQRAGLTEFTNCLSHFWKKNPTWASRETFYNFMDMDINEVCQAH